MVGVGSQSYFSITTILFDILLTGFIFLRSLNIGINSAIPSTRLWSSIWRKFGRSFASSLPSLTPHVNLALLPSIDFSFIRFTIVGLIVSTNTVTCSKRLFMTSNISFTFFSERYIVRPSIMTIAGASYSVISPLQSSMADIAIWDISPDSGRSFSLTAE